MLPFRWEVRLGQCLPRSASSASRLSGACWPFSLGHGGIGRHRQSQFANLHCETRHRRRQDLGIVSVQKTVREKRSAGKCLEAREYHPQPQPPQVRIKSGATPDNVCRRLAGSALVSMLDRSTIRRRAARLHARGTSPGQSTVIELSFHFRIPVKADPANRHPLARRQPFAQSRWLGNARRRPASDPFIPVKAVRGDLSLVLPTNFHLSKRSASAVPSLARSISTRPGFTRRTCTRTLAAGSAPPSRFPTSARPSSTHHPPPAIDTRSPRAIPGEAPSTRAPARPILRVGANLHHPDRVRPVARRPLSRHPEKLSFRIEGGQIAIGRQGDAKWPAERGSPVHRAPGCLRIAQRQGGRGCGVAQRNGLGARNRPPR